MKKIFTILAIICAFLTLIISVLPVSNLALFPGVAALLFGIIAFYLSKKTGTVKKIIQFSFLLTIMALCLSTYKAIFNKSEVGNTEQMAEKEETSKEEAIEELEELDLESIDLQE